MRCKKKFKTCSHGLNCTVTLLWFAIRQTHLRELLVWEEHDNTWSRHRPSSKAEAKLCWLTAQRRFLHVGQWSTLHLGWMKNMLSFIFFLSGRRSALKRKVEKNNLKYVLEKIIWLSSREKFNRKLKFWDFFSVKTYSCPYSPRKIFVDPCLNTKGLQHPLYKFTCEYMPLCQTVT